MVLCLSRVCKIWTTIFVGVLILFISAASFKYEAPDDCAWTFENNDTSKAILSCKLRTISNDIDKTNLSVLLADNTLKLRIECSEVLFFESTLGSHAFQRLYQLEELEIEYCKILRVPLDAFDGLRDLKKLTLRTHNSDWPSMFLELQSGCFSTLRELQVLDLGWNNIKAVPEYLFCSLRNLQTLNLTHNRLRSLDNLWFEKNECGLDVKSLDLSYNELQLFRNHSLSKLKRLQKLFLQNNELSVIEGQGLAGLTALHVFNVSSNYLVTLSSDLFKSSRDLHEIYLQNNSLKDLPPGLFDGLEQLLVLDLSNNQVTSESLNRSAFVGLIRLIVLDLSSNNLTIIHAQSFQGLYSLQILDLNNNYIESIDDNAFLPLYNLHTLNLANNNLVHVGGLVLNGLFVLSKLSLNNNRLQSLHPLAFQNCSDLKELDLSSNSLSVVPEALQKLTFLKSLDLGENQITKLYNGSFRNLHQLSGLRLTGNGLGNLTRGTLLDLTNLQMLNLAQNKIQHIERGTFDKCTELQAIRLDENYLSDINGVFSTLPHLQFLNLSDNHLVWFDYAFVPKSLEWLDIHQNLIEKLGNYYELKSGLSIKTLYANHNKLTEVAALSIPNSIEMLYINNNNISKVHPNTFLDKVNITRVYMYSNELVKLDQAALRLQPVPDNEPLPELYIGGNPFHCDCRMEWLQSINQNELINRRQYPRIMDLDNVMCKMTYSRGLPHLPIIDAHSSHFLCMYETHCFTLCLCCDFDACDCEMMCPTNCTCYHNEQWTANIVDCANLGTDQIPRRIPMDATEVYLDGNYLKELKNHVFIGRSKMTVLFVNNSRVESIQNRTFNGLSALQILHLEENRIKELKGFEFEHLSQLRELYLQNNLISTINNVTLLPLKSLEILRLDGNRLVTFPVWQLTLNSYLIEVTLSNNKWTCKCKFLQELQIWVQDNVRKVSDSDEIWCYMNDVEGTNLRHVIDYNGTCNDSGSVSVIHSIMISDYFPLMIVILSSFFIIVILCVAIFVYRDEIRVYVYSRFGIRLFQKAVQSEDREKLYDGYVCYSPKDEEFVVQPIVAELEHGNPSFQLCLHHRDLPLTSYVPPVVEAAEASRRVILILSRNFLQTEWSRNEFKSALHEALKGRTYKLILVEEGNLPEAELDPDLRPYLKTSSARVKWGDKRFWERLRYAMPSEHITNYRRNINNYTLDGYTNSIKKGHHTNNHHPHHTNSHHHLQHNNSSSNHPVFNKSDGTVTTASTLPRGYTTVLPVHRDKSELPDREAGYSSAVTGTPSPRIRNHHHTYMTIDSNNAGNGGVIGNNSARNSEHIYSSIDSDYSTLERNMSSTAMLGNHHHHHLHHSNSNVIGGGRELWRGRGGATTVVEPGGGQAYLV